MTSLPPSHKEPFDKVKKVYEAEIKIRDQKEEENKKKLLHQFIYEKKASSLICLFYHISRLFLKFLPRSLSWEALLYLEKALNDWRQTFQLLTQKDLSENTDFLKDLSHHFLLFLDLFKRISFHKHQSLQQEIQSFLDELNKYPSQDSYTLGFYLSHYAGLGWIPFPYMNILHNLYQDFVENQENSTLSKWIQTMGKIQKRCVEVADLTLDEK